MGKLDKLQPAAVWQVFEKINNIPRGSGNESGVMAMLKGWADERGLVWRDDAVGNLLIEIPGTKGLEKANPVLVQGHVDMVCEKNAATKHDFTKEPIDMKIEGDWVTAEGTTLGADNAIGCAMGLALADTKGVPHGPLELLLTVDEERGLTGAGGIEAGFFSARTMYNLDSEQDDAIFIGCAGGRDTCFSLKNRTARAPKNGVGRKVTVLGMKGGHSGLDIHKHRGNAIKILNRALVAASAEMDVRLVEINGGSMRNAIPREAEARVVIDRGDGRRFKQLVDAFFANLKSDELAGYDDGFDWRVAAVKSPRCFSLESSRNALRLVAAIPSGVTAMSLEIDGLVESSSNLGVIKTQGSRLDIVCCSRSSVMSTLAELVTQHRVIGELAGAEVDQPDGYPGWKPNLKSPLLAVTRAHYKRAFGAEAELLAIHAGLECGLLTEKYPDLDMISFGPNIHGAHSPDEKVQISSVQKIWQLFTATLADVAKG